MRFILLLGITLSSCYQAPDVEGFDKAKWKNSIEKCNDYRLEFAKQITSNAESNLLSRNQNEIKTLLGTPTRHRLFNRNQKFFYYQLDCQNSSELAVRFDALGRVKEITLEQTDAANSQ